ncbi:MAG: general secretion pathway protein GspK [Deltaproteobacteria bacterium]|nr:general secretion pathway protein GspK [Deltaproteobacteria bacterium]
MDQKVMSDNKRSSDRSEAEPGVYWGFPLAKTRHKRDHSDKEPQQKKDGRQKGIALLIAIMAIAVMMTFVTEMIVSSTVNVEMSLLGRDRVRSEFMARSGLNLGIYLLTANYLWDHIQASGALGEKKEPADGPESFWNMINELPLLGSDALDAVELLSGGKKEEDPFHLSGFMNEQLAAQMRLLEGGVSIKISDERGKINLNDCYSTSERSACEEVLIQLERLFSCPAEKVFLSKKNLSPGEMAHRIRDFILDSDKVSPYSNLASKDAPYESAVPPYQAKRTPFDSTEELRLIHGWDDEMHAVFAPYLTIYPLRKTQTRQNHKAGLININTAPRELLTCLFSDALAPESKESSLQKLYELEKLNKSLAENHNTQEIKGKLKDLFGYTSEETEREAEKAETWFTTRSDYFRFEIEANTGHQQRKLSAVIRRLNSAVADQSVRLREIKRAWQVLYWKVI